MDASPTPLPEDLCFAQAETTLLGLLLDDLHQGREPMPTLAAFDGERALALIGLRPFPSGELPQALIEVLALVLPLGADRLAFAASGRLWSPDDPIVPVCAEGDLRQRAIIVTVADGHDLTPRVTGSIYPFEGQRSGLTLLAPTTGIPADPAVTEGPLPLLLRGAVSDTSRLAASATPSDVVAQLGRVMLLGHQVALSPDTAATLTAFSAH